MARAWGQWACGPFPPWSPQMPLAAVQAPGLCVGSGLLVVAVSAPCFRSSPDRTAAVGLGTAVRVPVLPSRAVGRECAFSPSVFSEFFLFCVDVILEASWPDV